MWPFRRKQRAVFSFFPRWKEEMHVKGPGGQFMLDFPMGIPTVVLPSEERWAAVAPTWAKDLWPALRSELEAWCKANNTALELDARASVY